MGRLSESERVELWDRWEAGESQRSIARALGRSPSTVRTVLVSSQWRRPVPPREWSCLRLSFAEREEISRGIAEGLSLRSIAEGLGRSPSTVCREGLEQWWPWPVSGGGCPPVVSDPGEAP